MSCHGRVIEPSRDGQRTAAELDDAATGLHRGFTERPQNHPPGQADLGGSVAFGLGDFEGAPPAPNPSKLIRRAR